MNALRLLCLSALLVATAACAPHRPPDLSPTTRSPYLTADGWISAVRHFPGEGPPVLLVHGMGANHYNWDYSADLSMVTYLQGRGWDVWVAELRGDPQSVPPSEAARKAYSFDDHALNDVPAVLDVVRAQTGFDKVYWVGHSMGGMLLYTALELYPERLYAGVAIDSPAAMEDRSGLLAVARRFRWAVSKKQSIPAEKLARMTAGLGRANLLYGALANRQNLDYALANGLARSALEDVPAGIVAQVQNWLKVGDVTRVDGTPWFDRSRTDRPPVPILVTGGARDRIVPPANARAACTIFPTCTFVLLGRETGWAYDYGHVDPVVGLSAKAEVFPLVADFLDRAREAHPPTRP